MNFKSMNALHFMTVTAFLSVFGFTVLKTQPANAAAINFSLNIQPIDVCDNSGSNCAPVNLFQAETEKIWQQAGIGINFLTPTTISNTNFLSIDTDSEFSSLTNGALNGQSSNSKTLNMWFVSNLFPDPTNITFGNAYLGGNGVVINSPAIINNNRIDTIAHEIGHNLGLDHTTYGAGGANNLMTAGTNRTVPSSIFDINPSGNQLDVLTSQQISVATSSQLLTPVPEPVTILGSLVACVIGANLKIMHKKSSEE